MADDTFIFIPKGAPYIDTGVSPSGRYEDGQIHAFDSSDSDELTAAGRIQTDGAGFDVSTLLAAAIGLSLGGQTKFAAGSAAAPSITTTGNLDTGMFFPAANALAWSVGGSELARLTATGLGVGVTPSYALDIVGTTGTVGHFKNSAGNTLVYSQGGSGYGAFYARGSGTSDAFLFLGNATSGERGRVSADNAGDLFFMASGPNLIFQNSGGTERARLNATGFGLGTTSPAYPLDVSMTAAAVARFKNTVGSATAYVEGGSGYGAFYAKGSGTSSAYFFFGNMTSGERGRIAVDNSGDVALQASGSNLLFLNAGGTELGRWNSVGLAVGTIGANYKLDVAGAIGFTPGSSVTPADNGDVVFELTNNTTLTAKAKGSDGTVRSGTVALS